MVITSHGTDFLGGNLYVVFKRNRGCRNGLGWVNDAGFDWSNRKRFNWVILEYDRVILRFECSVWEREGRGYFLVDTMAQRLESSL